jgi:phage terminase large subunit-like protein
MKPDKQKAQGKIDGIVSLVMALDGVVRQPTHVSEPAVSWVG